MNLIRLLAIPVILVLAIAVVLSGCDQKQTPVSGPNTTEAFSGISAAGGPPAKLDTPTLTCFASSPTSITLLVTAGGTGAPAGFSIHWMTAAAYAANGNKFDTTNMCKVSFGQAGGQSAYLLGPNQSVQVIIPPNLNTDQIGVSWKAGCDAELECATDYVFQIFAHTVPGPGGLNKSDMSPTVTCSTSECGDRGCPECGCTYTQGFWKTHGPIPKGQNTNVWPVTSLTLGTVTYTDLQLLQIFNTPVRGNGYISLAHQLIAAKLNIANGADPSAISNAITAADAIIGSVVLPNGGTISPNAPAPAPWNTISGLVGVLGAYNEGTIGPGHCDD